MTISLIEIGTLRFLRKFSAEVEVLLKNYLIENFSKIKEYILKKLKKKFTYEPKVTTKWQRMRKLVKNFFIGFFIIVDPLENCESIVCLIEFGLMFNPSDRPTIEHVVECLERIL